MNLFSARDELVDSRRRPGVSMVNLMVETLCVIGVSYMLVGWLV